MFAFFPLILGFYVTLRLVLPLKFRARTKVFLTFIVFLIASYYLLNHFLMGGLSTPEQSPTYIICGGFLFVTLFLVTLFLVISDIILLFGYLLFLCKVKNKPIKRHRFLIPGILLAACCLSAIGVYEATKVSAIKKVDIFFNKLPHALDGLKIVQISDIHASPLYN